MARRTASLRSSLIGPPPPGTRNRRVPVYVLGPPTYPPDRPGGSPPVAEGGDDETQCEQCQDDEHDGLDHPCGPPGPSEPSSRSGSLSSRTACACARSEDVAPDPSAPWPGSSSMSSGTAVLTTPSVRRVHRSASVVR